MLVDKLPKKKTLNNKAAVLSSFFTLSFFVEPNRSSVFYSDFSGIALARYVACPCVSPGSDQRNCYILHLLPQDVVPVKYKPVSFVRFFAHFS